MDLVSNKLLSLFSRQIVGHSWREGSIKWCHCTMGSNYLFLCAANVFFFFNLFLNFYCTANVYRWTKNANIVDSGIHDEIVSIDASHQYLTNVQCWNRCNHGQTMHPKQKCISMNFLIISCVLTCNKKISLLTQKEWSHLLVLDNKNFDSG